MFLHSGLFSSSPISSVCVSYEKFIVCIDFVSVGRDELSVLATLLKFRFFLFTSLAQYGVMSFARTQHARLSHSS